MVAEADDYVSSIAQVHSQSPDVLVLDAGMSDGPSSGVISELRLRAPDTHVVALTMLEELGLAKFAFAAGALGFVPQGARRQGADSSSSGCRGRRGLRRPTGNSTAGAHRLAALGTQASPTAAITPVTGSEAMITMPCSSGLTVIVSSARSTRSCIPISPNDPPSRRAGRPEQDPHQR